MKSEKQSIINFQFRTESGVNVTEKIFEGRTRIFRSRQLAEAYARKIRSYRYLLECHEPIKKGASIKIDIYGYAVPK